MIKAQQLKTEIDGMIGNIEEDQNLLLYYALLDFRFKVLMDNLSITPASFEKIDSLNAETDDFYRITIISLKQYMQQLL